jgi:hypothetical protein
VARICPSVTSRGPAEGLGVDALLGDGLGEPFVVGLAVAPGEDGAGVELDVVGPVVPTVPRPGDCATPDGPAAG